jgi:hypothetical protein
MIKKIQFIISILTIIVHLNNFQTNLSLLVEIKGNIVIEQINNNETGYTQSDTTSSTTTSSEDLKLAVKTSNNSYPHQSSIRSSSEGDQKRKIFYEMFFTR